MTLRYDEADRLVEAADATRTIQYVYDGLGRRVERAEIPLAGALTATRYVYDGMRVVVELDGGYATLRSYTRGHDLSGTAEDAGGIGGLLALARPAGATWTAAGYHYDGTGNVTALVADDGTLAAAYTYGPYGERLSATGPLTESNPYQFSGKERDAATGLYYFGYRYYDPLAGRWLNRDPLQEAGGLNLYAYVANAPGTYMDPFGLCGTTAPNHIPGGGGGGGGGPNNAAAGTGVTVTLGYTNAAGHGIHGQNHALVIVTDNATGQQYATRAGPSGGLGSSQSAGASRASASGGSVSATAGNGGSGGHGFGSIYAEHGVYNNTFRDSPTNVHTLQPVGSLNISFSEAQARAREFATVTNNNSLPYRPVTLNSNSYAFTFVESLGFNRPQPVIGAPAWNSGRPDPNLSCIGAPTP